MGKYDKDISSAQKDIRDAGQVVTWRKPGAEIADSNEPWNVAADDPVNYTVSILFLPVSRIGQELERKIDKAPESATGNEQGLMGAVLFTPEVNDIVIRGTVEYRVKTIDVLAPNGEPILYTMEFYA